GRGRGRPARCRPALHGGRRRRAAHLHRPHTGRPDDGRASPGQRVRLARHAARAMTRAAESGIAQARGLSVLDAVAVLVGVVIGIGIFGFPPLVAQHAQSESVYLALWLGGAAVMLMGALCYAELGSAYPCAG